jgi:hypothetical protein
MKEKINKLDFIKIKIFCFCKGHSQENKREYIDWEKIFAKDISAKELLSAYKVHKELLKLKNKKTNNLTK